MKNPWREHAKAYDNAQGEQGDVAHELLFDPAIEQVLGNVEGKTILDAGCGNGYWVRRLAKSAKKVVGIDESEELIELARAKNNPSNVEFQTMDLTQPLLFENEVFDIVLTSMVLHYISSLETPASEFFRILGPSGRVIVCVQHPLYQYHFRAQEKVGKKSSKFSGTAGYFDRKELRQVTLLGGGVEVTTYNRPLEDYMHPFLGVGFVLTAFEEPEYTAEILKRHPPYQEIKEVPRVVILGFSKVRDKDTT